MKDKAPDYAPLSVRARPLALLLVGVLIAALAVLAPVGFALFGPGVRPANVVMVWLVVAGFLVLLFGYGLYERSRSLRVGYGRFEASSWFGARSAQLYDLGGISMRWSSSSEGSLQLPHVVFWDKQNGVIADVGVFFFERAALRRVVERLRLECPDLEVDRAVREYLGLL